MNISDVHRGPLVAEIMSGEEDCTLRRAYDVAWTCDGKSRLLTIPAGVRFWPGVQKMPLIARMFLRMIGVTKMFPAAAAHDPLYESQGGRRPIRINGDWVWLSLTDDGRNRVIIPRRECDLLSFHLSRAEHLRPWAGKIIRFVIRHFGKGAWDD